MGGRWSEYVCIINEVSSSELFGVVLLGVRETLCRADSIHINQAGASVYFNCSHPSEGLLYVELWI